jgi:hypothetical protein
MAFSAASLMRFAATSLATLIIGFAAIWGAFALWYQAPGGQSFKALSVLLWVGFALLLLIALWQGRTALAVLAFAAACGCL